MNPSSSAIGKAKATLLRALDQLEKAEQELDAEPDRVDLVVVYSIGRDDDSDGAWHEVGGWSSTAGPTWLHAALLRRAAEAFDGDPVALHDPPPDDEDQAEDEDA